MRKDRILVWDLPLRAVHWLLVFSFVGAFATAESERYAVWHVALGYAMLALVVFRIAWGFVGTRYARFSSFAFGPTAVLGYVRSLAAGKPLRYIGHNPAGSWMIYLLIAATIVVGATGYAIDAHLGPRWLEEIHEGAGNAMLGLVLVHVAGAIVSSVLHRENLPRAMVTGYKTGVPREGIRRARLATAIVLVGGFALLVGGIAQQGGLAPGDARAAAHAQDHDRDD